MRPIAARKLPLATSLLARTPTPYTNKGLRVDGVAVAVLDTGLWPWHSLVNNTRGEPRLSIRYDAIRDKEHLGRDRHGHGTHISSVILSSDAPTPAGYNGIAPDADIVSIKAFDDDGRGSYLNVIRGIDWAVRNKDLYNIRVMNLSFSAEPRSWYWDDPLNQAVMAAWRDGLVVVASAGNRGPDAMTIGVPGKRAVRHHRRSNDQQQHAERSL